MVWFEWYFLHLAFKRSGLIKNFTVNGSWFMILLSSLYIYTLEVRRPLKRLVFSLNTIIWVGNLYTCSSSKIRDCYFNSLWLPGYVLELPNPPRIPVTIRINDYIDYILGSRSQTFIRHHCILGVLFFGVLDDRSTSRSDLLVSIWAMKKGPWSFRAYTNLGFRNKMNRSWGYHQSYFVWGCTSPRS